MAVTVNKVTKEGSDHGSSKLYTGKAVMKLIAVNPDQKWLQEFMGFKQEKAPVYRTDKGQRVALFFEANVGEGETRIAHTSLFLKAEHAVGMFINKYGAWGKDSEKLGSTARRAYAGEINLIEFIKILVNSKRDQEVSLDAIDALVQYGDVMEIREIMEAAKDNEFYGLLYVQDGKYQAVFDTFERIYSKSSEYMHKQLQKQWDRINGDFGPISPKLFRESDFALRLYENKSEQKSSAPATQTVAPQAAPAPAPIKAAPAAAPTHTVVAAVEDEDNNPPF